MIKPTDKVISDIAFERHRQIGLKAHSAEHDDEHEDGELAIAAACYAAPFEVLREYEFLGRGPQPAWPWCRSGHNRGPREGQTRREQLVKAGALIVAEIERLDRNSHGSPDA